MTIVLLKKIWPHLCDYLCKMIAFGSLAHRALKPAELMVFALNFAGIYGLLQGTIDAKLTRSLGKALKIPKTDHLLAVVGRGSKVIPQNLSVLDTLFHYGRSTDIWERIGHTLYACYRSINMEIALSET